VDRHNDRLARIDQKRSHRHDGQAQGWRHEKHEARSKNRVSTTHKKIRPGHSTTCMEPHHEQASQGIGMPCHLVPTSSPVPHPALPGRGRAYSLNDWVILSAIGLAIILSAMLVEH
tara:strand:- start:423 stop:770 length:348 start_codon:yes stop_codon:yes gene_type:complete